MTFSPGPIRLAGAGHIEDADVLFVHATGFCKEVWHPVTTALHQRHRATRTVSLDLRGHGESERGGPPYRWDLLTDDVVFTMGERSGVVGVGHSCGGAIVARAAALAPHLFSSIVLIEPIILPPPYRRLNIPLARAAQRRRNSFPSRQAAYDRFRAGPMADWTDDALDAYVDHGFAVQDDALVIKCEPIVEADTFREGANHDTWDLVGDIDIPVTIVSGELSDTHIPAFLDMLEGQFKAPRMVAVAETGHFLPMERPEAVADLIGGVLASM